jgi:hypothetical protein
MLHVLRCLLKSTDGALTPKYTIISGAIASLIALSSIVVKILVLPAHATGI